MFGGTPPGLKHKIPKIMNNFTVGFSDIMLLYNYVECFSCTVYMVMVWTIIILTYLVAYFLVGKNLK